MDIIAVCVQELKTGDLIKFDFFKDETKAENHMNKLKNDLIKRRKADKYRVLKKEAFHDTEIDYFHF